MKTKKSIKNNIPKETHCYSDYQEELIESLKDQAHATAYLCAALSESLSGEEGTEKLFFRALKNVAAAQGNAREIEISISFH